MGRSPPPDRYSVRRRDLLAGGAGALALPFAGCNSVAFGEEEETADWAMPRNDAANTATTRGSSPAADPEVRWRFEADGRVDGAPAIVDDTAYVGTDDGRLYAIDADSGDPEWDVEFPSVVRPPAVVDGTVYAVVRREEGAGLAAIDADSGSREWTRGYDADGLGPPAIAGGAIFVAGSDPGLLALDAETGEEWWRADLPGEFRGTPAVYEGAVFIGRRRDGTGGPRSTVLALDGATGEELWSVAKRAEVVHSPAVDEGTVYVDRFAIDAVTGSPRWEADEDVGRSAAAVAGGLVFVDGDEAFRALNASTGAEVWSRPALGTAGTSPIVGAGTVYATGTDGYLHALESDDGDRRWRFDVFDRPASDPTDRVGSSPSVADGAVFVGSADGSVYAIE